MNHDQVFSVILTHQSRLPLAATHFRQAIQYQNPDRLMPQFSPHPSFHLTWGYRNLNKLANVYNCFEGHLECMRIGIESGKPLIAIYEDDCVPGPTYNKVMREILEHGPDHELVEVINFQGRAVGQCDRTTICGQPAIVPKRRPDKSGLKWCNGALHYLISREAAKNAVKWKWDGMPIDIRLVNELLMVILEPSPVIHDRSQGSLLEGTLHV